MSQIQQLLSAVNSLSERLNQIESNSKRIFELPANAVTNGLSKFAISRPDGVGEITEYITLNAILEWTIEEIQNIENATRLVQMLPPELLSSPRRIRIPVVDNQSNTVHIIWRILGVEYSKTEEQIIVIPDADEDNYRKDLILGTELGDVIRFAGTESTEGIIEPIQPENTVLLTSIVVLGDTVFEQPSNPIIGNQYITKLSEKINNISINTTPVAISLDASSSRIFRIVSAVDNAVIVGFADGLLWSGGDVWLWNDTDKIITISHNSDSGLLDWTAYFSETAQNFAFKPKTKALFKFDPILQRYEFFGSDLSEYATTTYAYNVAESFGNNAIAEANLYTDDKIEDVEAVLADKVQIGGDLGGTPAEPIVERLSAIAEPEKTIVPTILEDGTMQGEEIQELWVYDDTLTGYNLSELQAEYPTSAGRLQGFEVRCRLMTPPTTYRKESVNDSQWIKIELENVT